MADIVGSLFGLSVPELQAQRRQRMLDENEQFALMQAKNSPAPGMTYNQAMLGRSLGQAIGGALFGVQDPMIERARTVEGVLKGVMDSLTPEERNSKASVFSKLSEAFAKNPATQKEAVQAAMQASQFANEEENSRVNRSYKEALTATSLDAQERKNIGLAYNAGYALKSLLNSNVSPEKFSMAFKAQVEKLKAKGIDTTFLEQAQDPEEQVAAVDYLIGLGTSEKTRSSDNIAEKRAQISDRLLSYRREKDKIEQQLKEKGLDIKVSEGLKNRLASMDRAIVTATGVSDRLASTEKNLYTREQLSSRAKEIETLDTELQTQLDIKSLQADFELPMGEAKVAVKDYQSKLKDILNEKDSEGAPLYSLTKARELAKQYVASGINKPSGMFSKPSFKAPASEAKVELPAEAKKLLKEGLKTTFGNGQVWTLSNGKPTRLK